MSKIAESELILNKDGSVYHLNLLPEDISDIVINVGDPDRVSMVSDYFDTVEVKKQKREFDGIFFDGSENSTDPTVYLTGSGAHLSYFKDCFIYSNTGHSHIFKCDIDFDTHKLIFKDSTLLAQKAGSSFVRLNGGDVEFNSARILSNATGTGVCVSGSADLYMVADRLYIETYTDGNAFELASSRALSLAISNIFL